MLKQLMQKTLVLSGPSVSLTSGSGRKIRLPQLRSKLLYACNYTNLLYSFFYILSPRCIFPFFIFFVYLRYSFRGRDSNCVLFFEAYNALRFWVEWCFCSSSENHSNYEIMLVQCTPVTNLFSLCHILPFFLLPLFWGSSVNSRLYTSIISHGWWYNFDFFLIEFQNFTDYYILLLIINIS